MLPGSVSAADRAVGVVSVGATVAALVLSYRNLLDFATATIYKMPLALIFPLIIDSFVVYGELRLYSATWRKEDNWIKARMWAITIGGLAASVLANGWKYEHSPRSFWLAAAAAPLAAAIGLGVGLGLVKRNAQGADHSKQEQQGIPAGAAEPRSVAAARPVSADTSPARRPAGKADPDLVAKLLADRREGLPLGRVRVVERHGVTEHAARTALRELNGSA